jgi:hypothetical protein
MVDLAIFSFVGLCLATIVLVTCAGDWLAKRQAKVKPKSCACKPGCCAKRAKESYGDLT